MRLRSQVEAPIELWIAVIILAASMALAFLVMSQTGEAKCLAELRSQVRDLKMAMMDVAVGSPPTSREVVFRMPVCAGMAIDGLGIGYYTQAVYCTACPGRYGSCWKIEPIVYDAKTQSYRTSDVAQCVEMSGDIDIAQEIGAGGIPLGIPLYSGDKANAWCPTGGDRGITCSTKHYAGNTIRYANVSLTFGKDLKKAVDTYRIRLTKTLGPGGVAEAREKGQILVRVEPIK